MAEHTPIRRLLDGLGRRAVADAAGQNISAVHKWAQHDRIPAEHQAAVVNLARSDARFAYATADWMMATHAAKARQKRADAA